MLSLAYICSLLSTRLILFFLKFKLDFSFDSLDSESINDLLTFHSGVHWISDKFLFLWKRILEILFRLHANLSGLISLCLIFCNFFKFFFIFSRLIFTSLFTFEIIQNFILMFLKKLLTFIYSQLWWRIMKISYLMILNIS